MGTDGDSADGDDRRVPLTAHPNAFWMGFGWVPLGWWVGMDGAPEPTQTRFGWD